MTYQADRKSRNQEMKMIEKSRACRAGAAALAAAMTTLLVPALSLADASQVNSLHAEAGASFGGVASESADGTRDGSVDVQATGHGFVGYSQGFGLMGGAIDASGSIGFGLDGGHKQSRVRGVIGGALALSVGAELSHFSTGHYSENVGRIGWSPTLMVGLGEDNYLIVSPQLGGSKTGVSDRLGERSVSNWSAGGDLALKTDRFQLRGRGYYDWSKTAKRTELGASAKLMIGDVLGMNNYVGIDAQSVYTRDAKIEGPIAIEAPEVPARESGAKQITVTAGFAFD